MAGSKHTKLLKAAQKTASQMSKNESGMYKEIAYWKDGTKHMLKYVSSLEKSLTKDVNKYFKNMDIYENKVKEINGFEAELKNSPKDKIKLKQLKDAEKNADNALKAVNVIEKNIVQIEVDIMHSVGIRRVPS